MHSAIRLLDSSTVRLGQHHFRRSKNTTIASHSISFQATRDNIYLSLYLLAAAAAAKEDQQDKSNCWPVTNLVRHGKILRPVPSAPSKTNKNHDDHRTTDLEKSTLTQWAGKRGRGPSHQDKTGHLIKSACPSIRPTHSFFQGKSSDSQ